MPVVIKRVYEEPSRRDGVRVLVDRLWPRGLSKADAKIDAWLRELAPSDELRREYHSHPEGWASFRRQYLKELTRPEAASGLEELYRLAEQRRRLTLLFASKNVERNNATVLRDLLEGMRKPPTGTGPGAVRSQGQRAAGRAPRR